MKEGSKTLNEIAEREYDALYKYCLKRSGGDEQLAGECAAEAFLRAERLGDPPEHPNIAGWLRRTARNVMQEKLRERKTYYQWNVSLDKLIDNNSPMLAPFFEREDAFLEKLWNGGNDLNDEEIELVKLQLLAMLPPDDRELMRLRYEENQPINVIAERVGRSKDAVRVKLSRLADKVTEMVRNYFDGERE